MREELGRCWGNPGGATAVREELGRSWGNFGRSRGDETGAREVRKELVKVRKEL